MAINTWVVSSKRKERVEKYQNLKREIATIWSMRKVEVIAVVVGLLEKYQKNLTNGSKDKDRTYPCRKLHYLGQEHYERSFI